MTDITGQISSQQQQPWRTTATALLARSPKQMTTSPVSIQGRPALVARPSSIPTTAISRTTRLPAPAPATGSIRPTRTSAPLLKQPPQPWYPQPTLAPYSLPSPTLPVSTRRAPTVSIAMCESIPNFHQATRARRTRRSGAHWHTTRIRPWRILRVSGLSTNS